MSNSEIVSRHKAPRNSWQVAWAVWRALFMREVLTRISGRRMGWLWIFAEPLVHVGILMILFSTLRQRAFGTIDFALFLAIGYLGYHTFVNISRRSGAALGANRALLAYRQVHPIDTVLARIGLEFALQILVIFILLALASVFGFDVLPHDPLTVIAAISLLALMGAGLGLIFSALFHLVPETEKIVAFIYTPLYFASGIMYSPSAMPYAAQKILLFNPIVHGVELLRGAFFEGYHVLPEVSWGYLAAYALGFTLLGLLLHRRFSNKLLAR